MNTAKSYLGGVELLSRNSKAPLGSRHQNFLGWKRRWKAPDCIAKAPICASSSRSFCGFCHGEFFLCYCGYTFQCTGGHCAVLAQTFVVMRCSVMELCAHLGWHHLHALSLNIYKGFCLSQTFSPQG
ncbi:hypothetical protein VTK26DRAFT_3510 [Humicola hyalothermophila]